MEDGGKRKRNTEGEREEAGEKKIEGWKDIWRKKMVDEMRKRGWQMEGEREEVGGTNIER